ENPGAEHRPGTDLPGGSAANQRHIRGDLLDAVEQLAQVIAKRREDEQELRIRACHGRASRFNTSDAVRWIPGAAGTHLAGCRGPARLPDDRGRDIGGSHVFSGLHQCERGLQYRSVLRTATGERLTAQVTGSPQPFASGTQVVADKTWPKGFIWFSGFST